MMKINKTYLLFYAVVILVQILLLNNLTISTLIAPMAYISCVIMMPLSFSPMRLLIYGLLLALLMDLTMGVVGLNVIATLPIAFFRRPILHFVADYSDFDNEGGVPTPKRLGSWRFHRYVVVTTVLHSLIFFCFELLSFNHFWFSIGRIVFSTLATLAVIYVLIAIFTPRLTAAK